MQSVEFVGISNLRRVEGLVTCFDAVVNINDIQHSLKCTAGGNSIYMKLSGKGQRLCFASHKLEDLYIQKLLLIEKIIPSFVPKIYGFGESEVSFSKDFAVQFLMFVKRQNLPEYIMDKYELLNTIRRETFVTPHIITEHLEESQRSDPFHKKIKVDDLKHITASCLDAGIYVGYVPRISNVVNTKFGTKYLDFDEWVVVDEDLFRKSLIKHKII